MSPLAILAAWAALVALAIAGVYVKDRIKHRQRDADPDDDWFGIL